MRKASWISPESRALLLPVAFFILDRSWRLPPLGLPLLLFIAFATLVVHVSQRLIERTTLVIDPAGRKSAIIRTALCVGALAWALDLAGLFLFAEFHAQSADLLPVCLALILLIASAWWAVPLLSNTRSSRPVALAAVGLTGGICVSHLMLMNAVGAWVGDVRWKALTVAAGATSLVITWLALQHRAAQLRSIQGAYEPTSWLVKILSSVLLLPIYVALVNAFPITPTLREAPASGLAVLTVLVLSGVAFSVDQMFKLRDEEKREQAATLALAASRRVDPPAADGKGYLLALIAERLPALLSDSSMELHFQPICSIRSDQRTARFEALLRVSDRDLGRIHPELFFLACERARKTSWADRLLLLQALETSVSWLGAESGCEGISVNMAPATLLEDDFVTWLEDRMTAQPWPPGWLQLEITEHALIAEAPRLAHILRHLKQLGIRIAMDDFGAGFSSLTALADLPIHVIKCDRAFVKDLSQDAARQMLLRYICEMGKGLGLIVTIEGIETEAELAIARQKGAESVQGYLLGRPMPAAQVPAWLHAWQSTAERTGLTELEACQPA